MGPPPNNCVHRLRSSLLQTEGDARLFTQGLVLAFGLEDAPSRVERARALLRQEGFPDAAAARAHFRLPVGRWLCRPFTDGQVYDNTTDEEVGILGGMVFTHDEGFRPTELSALHAAVILGLCGPAFYAADRPMVWSEARLGRRLVLYRATDFYDESP